MSLRFTLLLAIVALNGFFAAAEVALAAVGNRNVSVPRREEVVA